MAPAPMRPGAADVPGLSLVKPHGRRRRGQLRHRWRTREKRSPGLFTIVWHPEPTLGIVSLWGWFAKVLA